MKIKQIVLSIGLAIAIVAPVFTIANHELVRAASCGTTKNAVGEDVPIETSIIGGDICAGVDNSSDNVENNAIWKILTWVVNIMVAGVGILAVAGIVYGSILYTTAGGSQEQVKKAMGIFTNTAIGVIAFALMYVLLQWLIPGGVF